MLASFLSIGLLMLMAVMLPGPDFALVIKNTILHNRRAGIFTSFGIGLAVIVHMTYCILGLALIISESLLLFSLIKYLGAAYLIYLGIHSFRSKQENIVFSPSNKITQKSKITDFIAIQQGFLCNLLNPKATLFFLALFTVIIKPGTSLIWQLAYGIEMLMIAMSWFIALTFFLSHPRILRLLNKMEKYIAKTLGVFLIVFGICLALIEK
ncbi:MAG: lysine transporter LysE [Gammaproteobacteria bacterium RIFCSPHIGHO2_12_FULL_37_14]|nr:MAG: lysine transporter LysE [Gammaproteobacteria bacterium RIFCSPHIGHO2_12_FULL_37_14]